MNRDIKFRGKRLDNNEWVNGIPITTHIGIFIVTEENPHYCSMYGYMEIDELYQVAPETICQFTGLYDKNGKKIFEKDIIRDHQTNKIGYIGWLPQECGFVIVWKKSDSRWGHRNRGGYQTDHSLEVIGNIFDNYELLEGGEK